MRVDLEDRAILILHWNACHGAELLDHLDNIGIRWLATSLELTEEQLSVLCGHLKCPSSRSTYWHSDDLNVWEGMCEVSLDFLIKRLVASCLTIFYGNLHLHGLCMHGSLL